MISGHIMVEKDNEISQGISFSLLKLLLKEFIIIRKF